MKINTNELQGAALDWAVAMAENWAGADFEVKPYCTDWAHGGPIIELEGIALYLYGGSEWNAHVGGRESVGPTPLIAAMRCFVASKLGDEIDLPDELV